MHCCNKALTPNLSSLASIAGVSMANLCERQNKKKKRIKKDARKILVNFPAKRNSTEECLRCQFRILATLFAFTCASVFQFSQEFPVSLFHNSTSSQEMCIYACVCVCVRFSLLCDLVEDAKSTCWLAPTPC